MYLFHDLCSYPTTGLIKVLDHSQDVRSVLGFAFLVPGLLQTFLWSNRNVEVGLVECHLSCHFEGVHLFEGKSASWLGIRWRKHRDRHAVLFPLFQRSRKLCLLSII